MASLSIIRVIAPNCTDVSVFAFSLNNYSACLRAARIYEYGVKPDSSQALYGFNVAYDAQEAKRYYKKVCESISDDAPEACKKIVDLTHKTHSYKYLIKKQ